MTIDESQDTLRRLVKVCEEADLFSTLGGLIGFTGDAEIEVTAGVKNGVAIISFENPGVAACEVRLKALSA